MAIKPKVTGHCWATDVFHEFDTEIVFERAASLRSCLSTRSESRLFRYRSNIRSLQNANSPQIVRPGPGSIESRLDALKTYPHFEEILSNCIRQCVYGGLICRAEAVKLRLMQRQIPRKPSKHDLFSCIANFSMLFFKVLGQQCVGLQDSFSC